MTGPTRLNLGTVSTAAIKNVAAVSSQRVSDPRVDVSTDLVIPVIVRGGHEVPAPKIDTRIVEDVISRYTPLKRIAVPRAVSQSVPPGTRVAKGTPVDLVFIPVADLDMSLFTDVHADFKTRNIAQVLPIVEDAAVRPILEKATFDQLTEADRATLTARLGANNIGVVETDPTRTLQVAFNTLQSARAFQ
jgi:hypothetical protein